MGTYCGLLERLALHQSSAGLYIYVMISEMGLLVGVWGHVGCVCVCVAVWVWVCAKRGFLTGCF